jgi:hypothetical protein
MLAHHKLWVANAGCWFLRHAGPMSHLGLLARRSRHMLVMQV